MVVRLGWDGPLTVQKTGKVKFLEGVRRSLDDQFEAGEKTGHKADPARVFSTFARKRRKEYLSGNAADKEENEKCLESDTDEALELETQAGVRGTSVSTLIMHSRQKTEKTPWSKF